MNRRREERSEPVRESPAGTRWVILGLAALVAITAWLLLRMTCGRRGRRPAPSIAETEPARKRSPQLERYVPAGKADDVPERGTADPSEAMNDGAPRDDRLPQTAASLGRQADRGSRRAGKPGASPVGTAPPGGSAANPETDPEPPTIWPADAHGIRSAIRERIEEIKECYEGWLALDPELGGALTVSFAIEPTEGGRARVSQADISVKDFHHPWLEGCVLAMIETLAFENPASGSVKVRYPFRFAASQDPPE